MKETKISRDVPELLLPVGGIRQLAAAVENGADAVYLGGRRFNARINAENFSDEELARAVSLAHAYDVKVYATTNTLLYDDELLPAIEYAEYLYEIGVDALIIQDLGFAAMVKKYIEDFELHLSTQASIYNLSGVLQAKELGFSRVVLARENNLSDIRRITEQSDMEIEVFVHGAICVCYSGQCHLSRSIGNRSGNRGECAQPCRLKYQTPNGNLHALSPRDLSCIEYLKEISEAGVSSLKIEGRMKSAEYIAVVCKIYRKYLDKYKEYGNYEVTEEDLRALRQVFSRGEFTNGYFFGDKGEAFMSKKMPKHQGIYIGKAVRKVSDTLVDVKLEKDEKLSIGDGVEFKNAELSGNILSYLRENKDGTFRIGDIRKNVGKGDALYKISDKEQLKQANESIFRIEHGKGERKSAVEMEIYVRKNREPVLTVSSAGKQAVLTGAVKAQGAKNLPLTSDMLQKQLAKLGGTPFELTKFSCDIDDNISLPVSAVNELRRLAIDKLFEEKTGRREFKLSSDPISLKFAEAERKIDESKAIEIYFHEFDLNAMSECEEILKYFLKHCKDFKIAFVIPVWDLMHKNVEIERFKCKAQNVVNKKGFVLEVIPYVFPITAGKYDDYIKSNIEEITNLAKSAGIYAGNLGTLHMLRGKDVEIFADYGMNITNVQAEKCAYEMGFSRVFYSHEVNKNAYGKLPLMISEHRFFEDEISLKNRYKYRVNFIKYLNKSIIYEKKDPEEVLKEIDFMGNIRIYI